MAEPLSVTFRRDVNFENDIVDLEKLITMISDSLALQLPQSEFPALIITGESSNTNGIAAYSAQRLVPGIRLKVQSNDFNYDTGENRIIGGNDAYTMRMSVIASADPDPGIIVRRDINGDFAGNQLTANSIVLNYPNITVNGKNIFNSDGKLIVDSEGTSDEAVNVSGEIGGVNITEIFVTNVSGGVTNVVKDAANVNSTIKGVSIVGDNNTDPSTGIFMIGNNADGSDTYAKRALYAVAAGSLRVDGLDVEAGNFARKDADNIFLETTTSTFGNIVTTNFTGTEVVATRLTFPQTAAPSRPSTPSFYVGDIAPNGLTRVNFNGHFYATRIGNAQYNDLAECFYPISGITYRDAVNRIVEICEDEKIRYASKNSHTAIGIVSDNYGYLLGGSDEEIKASAKIPVGIAGTLWVKLDSSVDIDDISLGDYIYSGDEGYALVTAFKEDVDIDAVMIGKIININKDARQVKVILMLS